MMSFVASWILKYRNWAIEQNDSKNPCLRMWKQPLFLALKTPNGKCETWRQNHVYVVFSAFRVSKARAGAHYTGLFFLRSLSTGCWDSVEEAPRPSLVCAVINKKSQCTRPESSGQYAAITRSSLIGWENNRTNNRTMEPSPQNNRAAWYLCPKSCVVSGKFPDTTVIQTTSRRSQGLSSFSPLEPGNEVREQKRRQHQGKRQRIRTILNVFCSCSNLFSLFNVTGLSRSWICTDGLLFK